ncbi:MAG TPA: DUF29 domain-containing protein [Stellaceae bacterium]|nr:DUF29 domain-containing protein [Stellaceae bacterium]
MTDPKRLYEEDFVLWSQQQAAALRAAGQGATNQPLDWDNLAEEIEDLGKSTRRELRSRLLVILEHLLKLEYSPAVDPRAGWRETIGRERSSIEDLLGDSPSLRGELADMIAKTGSRAVRLAAHSLSGYGEAAAKLLPPDYSVEQVLGDWFPEEPPRE